jgi:hypothetical protein
VRVLVLTPGFHSERRLYARQAIDSIEEANCSRTKSGPRRYVPSAARTRTSFPSNATANARTGAAPAARNSAA